MKAELIAPCGMNCALCASYLAMTHGVRGKGVRLPYCAGCRQRPKICALLKKRCGRLRLGNANYCFECPEFPCHGLATIDKRYRERYRMSMVENLMAIERDGMDQFLKAQRKTWPCPKCGGTVCCHNGLCFHCDLETLKGKTAKYRWEEP